MLMCFVNLLEGGRYQSFQKGLAAKGLCLLPCPILEGGEEEEEEEEKGLGNIPPSGRGRLEIPVRGGRAPILWSHFRIPVPHFGLTLLGGESREPAQLLLSQLQGQIQVWGPKIYTGFGACKYKLLPKRFYQGPGRGLCKPRS
jgi:hypothetical protein